MKSEKLTVPEYFWARFKGKNKASSPSSLKSNGQGADYVDRLMRNFWAVMPSGIERPVTTDDNYCIPWNDVSYYIGIRIRIMNDVIDNARDSCLS